MPEAMTFEEMGEVIAKAKVALEDAETQMRRARAEISALRTEALKQCQDAFEHERSASRFAPFLRERSAWLKYEADNGGAPSLREEARILLAIATMIDNKRHLEDGRPSWLIDRIPLPEERERP